MTLAAPMVERLWHCGKATYERYELPELTLGDTSPPWLVQVVQGVNCLGAALPHSRTEEISG